MDSFLPSSRPELVIGYAIAGAVLGTVVNTIVTWVQWFLGLRTPLLRLLVSLVLVASVPTLLSLTRAGRQFVGTWQLTIPGLYFAAMFFSAQLTLMTDATSAQMALAW